MFCILPCARARPIFFLILVKSSRHHNTIREPIVDPPRHFHSTQINDRVATADLWKSGSGRGIVHYWDPHDVIRQNDSIRLDLLTTIPSRPFPSSLRDLFISGSRSIFSGLLCLCLGAWSIGGFLGSRNMTPFFLVSCQVCNVYYACTNSCVNITC